MLLHHVALSIDFTLHIPTPNNLFASAMWPSTAGEMSVKELMRNWFFSYAGNLVGSLLMVAAVAAAGSLVGNAMPVNMAVAKTSLDFGTTLVRGILAKCVWDASQGCPRVKAPYWLPEALHQGIAPH